MPDYKTRFILNPTKIVWFSPFLCVNERQRKRIRDTESVQGVNVSSIKKYMPCPWQMYWVLIKKVAEEGGGKGGALTGTASASPWIQEGRQ